LGAGKRKWGFENETIKQTRWFTISRRNANKECI